MDHFNDLDPMNLFDSEWIETIEKLRAPLTVLVDAFESAFDELDADLNRGLLESRLTVGGFNREEMRFRGMLE